MRIYSTKTYILWPAKIDGRRCMVDGKELRAMVKSSGLIEGDTIYEATEFARVKEKKSVELIDANGTPVEEAAGEEDIVQ